LLLALATAGVLVVGAQAASAQVIEICKSSSNGMSGRAFNYTVAPSGGSAFSVGPIAGGRCSGPISVAGATAVITEQQSDPATDVKSVTVRPSARKLSEDLGNRRVTVATGLTTASETLVTFVNQPAGGNYAPLKVCKLTETPAYLGRSFSFSVNGGPLQSTEANDAFDDPANYTCRILGTFQVGSIVNVHEQIPAGTEVQWIDTDPGENLLDFNTATGDATVLITATATIVYYDNEPTPPAGTGWIEVCKNVIEIDPDISGPFSFTVTDAAGATYSLTVLAGQCSEPIQVAAGVNTVTETAKAGTELVAVFTFPEDRLLTTNLINRTATVEVPVSDSPNDETQVHFFNKAQRGQLKVCKALGPGSADLVNQHFDFTAAGDNGQTEYFSITAAASTQCRIVNFFPIGTTVTVTENLAHGPGDPGEFIDTTGEGDVVIAPGVNTLTVTNTARGLLEVCKAPIRPERAVIRLDQLAVPVPTPVQPLFRFRIDGGAIFTVQAGKCSPPKRVSVGNHTVTEVAENDYELDPDAPGNGITVFPADREVSRSLASRTVTVSVPYGPNGETLVTFYNRIKRGMVKICKQIPITSQDALGGKEFSYDLYYRDPWGNVALQETLGPILPGECTSFSRSLPVLQPNGKYTAIGVVERPTNGTTSYTVQSITLQGTRGLCPNPALGLTDPNRDPVICNQFPNNPNLALGIVNFYLAPGPNVVTYTNKAVDP
jgi:hypothetical protein